MDARLMVVVVLLAGAGCSGSDGNSDAGQPDAGQPDAGSPDAASPDAASLDRGSPDAALPDMASPDSLPPDTAPSGDVGSFWSQDGSSADAGTCTGGWARSFGEPNVWDDISTTMDSAGDLVMAKYFYNSGGKVGGLTLQSQGKGDFYLAKMDCRGKYRWVQAVGGKGSDDVDFLGADQQGNIYVVGHTADTARFGKLTVSGKSTTSLYVAKVSPAGEFTWVSTFGPFETKFRKSSSSCWNYFTDMTVDAAGNVYLTGVLCGILNLDATTLYAAGIFDLMVVKLDAKGKFVWARVGSSGWYDGASDVAVDSKGNIYVAGGFGGYNPKYCSGSRTITLDSITLKSAGCSDALVAKLDPNGKFIWAVAAGGPAADGAGYILLHDSGDLFITGGHGSYKNYAPQSAPTFGGAKVIGTNKTGGFLARLTTAGKFKWAKIDMGTAGDISPGPGKSILVSGGPGYPAATRMSPHGVPLKSYMPVGSTNQHAAYYVSYNKLTGLALSGVFMGTATFGKQNLTSKGKGMYAVDAYLWWIPPSKL